MREDHDGGRAGGSQAPPQNSAGARGRAAQLVRRLYSSHAARAVAGVAVVSISAAAFYRVREMLAALLFFAAIFVVAALFILILWLVEEAAHKAALSLETILSHLPGRHVHTPARARSQSGT